MWLLFVDPEVVDNMMGSLVALAIVVGMGMVALALAQLDIGRAVDIGAMVDMARAVVAFGEAEILYCFKIFIWEFSN